MRNSKIIIYLEVAIMSAAGLILDYISAQTWNFAWLNGGSISIAMLVIFIMAYRRGFLYGLLTGFIIGLVQILYAGSYFLNFVQAFFDYYGAYTVVGLAGIFYPWIRRRPHLASVFLILGAFLGSLVRFALHVASGVLYWETGFWASVVYNGTYMLPSFLIVATLLVIIYSIQPTILVPSYREE
jgi:thiamine transporter